MCIRIMLYLWQGLLQKEVTNTLQAHADFQKIFQRVIDMGRVRSCGN